jgi:hypothetical protein
VFPTAAGALAGLPAVALAPLFAVDSVVELGAGTGLASIAIAASWAGRHGAPLTSSPSDPAVSELSTACPAFFVTDGDVAGVANVQHNLTTNAGLLGDTPVSATVLRWGLDTVCGLPMSSGGRVGIIASDVVYDPCVIDALVATLGAGVGCEPTAAGVLPRRGRTVRDTAAGTRILSWMAGDIAARCNSWALVSSTMRQPATFSAFVEALAVAGLATVDVSAIVHCGESQGGGGRGGGGDWVAACGAAACRLRPITTLVDCREWVGAASCRVARRCVCVHCERVNAAACRVARHCVCVHCEQDDAAACRVARHCVCVHCERVHAAACRMARHCVCVHCERVNAAACRMARLCVCVHCEQDDAAACRMARHCVFVLVHSSLLQRLARWPNAVPLSPCR